MKQVCKTQAVHTCVKLVAACRDLVPTAVPGLRNETQKHPRHRHGPSSGGEVAGIQTIDPLHSA